MTDDEIRRVVKLTLDELHKRDYPEILAVTEHKLEHHFNGCADISEALSQLADDPYVNIIYWHYKEHKTLEWIAEKYLKDVSTIKRHKKQLILRLWELLEGA